mgnify:CR=1 FL=1
MESDRDMHIVLQMIKWVSDEGIFVQFVELRIKDKDRAYRKIYMLFCNILEKNKLVDTNYNCLLEFHLMKNIEKKTKIMILKGVMKR